MASKIQIGRTTGQSRHKRKTLPPETNVKNSAQQYYAFIIKYVNICKMEVMSSVKRRRDIANKMTCQCWLVWHEKTVVIADKLVKLFLVKMSRWCWSISFAFFSYIPIFLHDELEFTFV